MMRLMNRAFTAAVLTGLLATSAFAASASAPLPAGKPAGVKEANMQGSGLLWIGFAAIIAVTVAIVASDNDDTGPSTTTTGTP